MQMQESESNLKKWESTLDGCSKVQMRCGRYFIISAHRTNMAKRSVTVGVLDVVEERLRE